MQKKIIALLMSGAMLLGLCSCGGGSNVSNAYVVPEAGFNLDEPVEITGLKVGIVGLGVSGKMIAEALQFLGAEVSYYSRSRKRDAELAGMAYKPLHLLLEKNEVIFTCLNKNVLLLQKPEFAALGNG